jgi:hypothetical protein
MTAEAPIAMAAAIDATIPFMMLEKRKKIRSRQEIKYG